MQYFGIVLISVLFNEKKTVIKIITSKEEKVSGAE